MDVRTYAAVRTKIIRFSFIWRLEARQSLDLVVLAHWGKLREGQVYICVLLIPDLTSPSRSEPSPDSSEKR